MRNNSAPLDVLLINPPYVTLTSRLGVGHQIPLGLLMVAGALLDAGISAKLLDAEAPHLTIDQIRAEVQRLAPRIVMTGHAGSTPAHETCIEMLAALKKILPNIITIYGGPFPTYHAAEILRGEGVAGCDGKSRGVVDVIVRGEGEATAVDLVRAILHESPLEDVKAIAFLQMGDQASDAGDPLDWDIGGRRGSPRRRAPADGSILITPERPPLAMDDYRIAWELLDDNNSWDDYHCFGLGRAVIVQLSRGCPHACTYCGQRGFWMKWRHRNPIALVDEIEWLATHRGVRFITLADENPTTLLPVWHTFLQELARRKLPVKFFATIRATDIVRDAAALPLWHAAGLQYILMGIDATDEATLKAIKKGSTTRVDFAACRLLRDHGIFSMIARIVGLSDERWIDFWRTARQVALYDGDYLNVMYGTPHAWTQYAQDSRHREVVDERLAHFTYRWPILGQRHMRVWETFLAVKLLEAWFHLRPRRLWRLLTQSKFSRQQFWWCVTHIGRVWGAEIGAFLKEWPLSKGRTLAEFYARPLGETRHEERLINLRISTRSAPGSAGGSTTMHAQSLTKTIRNAATPLARTPGRAGG